jgi:hypothetical protein
MFLGQYGAATAIKISEERFDSFGAAEESPEFLGQMKRIQPRFSQSAVSPDDVLILCGRPPATWTASNLAGSQSLAAPALKRRLLSQAPADLEAVVIRCTEGSGQAITGSWAEEIPPDKKETEAGEGTHLEIIPEATAEIMTEAESQTVQHGNYQPESISPEIEPADQAEEVIALGEGETILVSEEIPVLAGETEQARLGFPASASTATGSPFLLGIARAWMNAKTVIAKIRLFGGKATPGFLKKQNSGLITNTPMLAVLVALILPVGLIIMGVSVYMRTGKAEQFESYFSQAQESYALAEKEKDPLQRHAYWAQTVELASKAEEFNVTRDSRLLFEQAQFLMDEMDLAARLEFRPALTSFLPQGVVVSRIRSSFSGLYLLDVTSGSILRLFLNTKGFYDIDEGFKCSPGPYGLVTVTELVDFITLPANEDNHRVAGVDGQGNLLYCRSDAPPVSNTLTPPDGGWGRIAALGYDQDTLYILDSQTSSLWMYAGKNPNKMDVPGATGIFFVESPIRFLDEDVPDFKGGVNLAVNQAELYVLHEDGHMTLCRYSPTKEVRLTECQDPAPYTDNRVGREDRKPWIFMDAHFTMMQDLKVPTLSIFILDTQDPSVYQFSFQLNLERTLRITRNKNFPLPDTPPSGFGVTPDMELILAYDNRLYLAPMR